MKPTYRPNKRKRLKTHGFLARTTNRSGFEVLNRRRRKLRAKLTVSEEKKKFTSHHHAPQKRKIKRKSKNSTNSASGPKV